MRTLLILLLTCSNSFAWDSPTDKGIVQRTIGQIQIKYTDGNNWITIQTNNEVVTIQCLDMQPMPKELTVLSRCKQIGEIKRIPIK